MALTLGLLTGNAIVAAPAAQAVTVPNMYAVVYRCTAWARWRCVYAYTYQTNPPYNPSVPRYYYRVNQYVWYWV